MKFSLAEKSAKFSPCRKWRYTLTRRFADGNRCVDGSWTRCVFIGLNPSTADESSDDPTIRRCLGFAFESGYSELVMLNAYAFRATDPKVMKAYGDPVGPENDEHIESACRDAGIVVAAWGVHCERSRADRVCDLVLKHVDTVFCLGVTKDGSPKHPLYLPSDSPFITYRSRKGMP